MTALYLRFKNWATNYKNSWAVIIAFIMMIVAIGALWVSLVALNK